MTTLLKPEELAEKLHVSPRSLRNWQVRRIIPYIKFGRVIRFDLEKVMAALEKYERKAVS